jgi:hypothetical protein
VCSTGSSIHCFVSLSPLHAACDTVAQPRGPWSAATAIPSFRTPSDAGDVSSPAAAAVRLLVCAKPFRCAGAFSLSRCGPPSWRRCGPPGAASWLGMANATPSGEARGVGRAAASPAGLKELGVVSGTVDVGGLGAGSAECSSRVDCAYGRRGGDAGPPQRSRMAESSCVRRRRRGKSEPQARWGLGAFRGRATAVGGGRGQ